MRSLIPLALTVLALAACGEDRPACAADPQASGAITGNVSVSCPSSAWSQELGPRHWLCYWDRGVWRGAHYSGLGLIISDAGESIAYGTEYRCP